MPSNHLILSHHPLPPPSLFPSIRLFSNESVLRIRWPKYWSFSFNTSPSNEYSGLISFRMDWLDLLAVQETFKSLQHHSSKASILWHSAFFLTQLSNPYMTIGKTIDLTRQNFVGKVMMTPLLGFHQFATAADITQGNVLLEYRLIIRGCNSGTARGKRCLGKEWGRLLGLPYPLQTPLSPKLHLFSDLKTEILAGFYGSFSTKRLK